jgi:hypothetical protein
MGKKLWWGTLRDYLNTQRQLQLERMKAGRFYMVTCEHQHVTQMSGLDIARRLNFYKLQGAGEMIQCPECYELVRLVSIADGPLMNDEQRKQQEEDYVKWSQEQKRLREQREFERSVDAGIWLGWP